MEQLEQALPPEVSERVTAVAETAAAKSLALGYTVSLPVTLGGGFDNYYGPGIDVAGYVGAGVKGSVPLTFISSAYGSWKLSAGVDLLLRDNDVRAQDGRFADKDTAAILGTVGIKFTY